MSFLGMNFKVCVYACTCTCVCACMYVCLCVCWCRQKWEALDLLGLEFNLVISYSIWMLEIEPGSFAKAVHPL